MGLVVLEGCEDFLVWGPTVGTPTFTLGRTGNCINCGSSAGYLYLLHPHQESDVITLGFAMRYILHSGSGYPAVAFLMSDTSATVHVEVGVNIAGQIEVRRASTSLTPLSATGVIQMDRWHYVEVQARLHDTAGWIIVRVDGATVITTATNLDTKNAGTKTVFDACRVYSSSGNNVRFDDIYLMSGAGDPFLGPISVETLRPNGNGAVNQWTGSDGDALDNWQLVDESPVDSGSYVYSPTVGQQDLYTMGDLQRADGTIIGVTHAAQMIRTDSVTPRSVKLLNRRTAITAGPAVALGTGYRGVAQTWTYDPDTAGFGTPQRPTVNGTPATLGTGEAGPRFQFSRPGRITGVRYQRHVGGALTAAFRMWDSVGTKLADVNDTQANVAGWFTVTFPTPVAITAGIYGFSIGGSNVSVGSPLTPSVTNTADVIFVGMYSASVGSWPTSFDGSNTYFIEPIYEPVGGPWTVPNVNALQSGVELA